MATWGRWYLADRDPRWVRRNALVVLGNVGDPGDAAVVQVLADYRAHAGPGPARPRRVGHRTAWVWRPGEAPARHERLPAEDRRHPVAAVGVVAAVAARVVRRAHQSRTTAPPSSTPRSRSASSAPASRCCCRTRGWCSGSTPWPSEVGADLIVLDPALPLGLIGPSLRSAVRRGAPRRRGHRARPAAAVASRRSGTCCAAPGTSSPPVATRQRRPSTPPGRSCRSRWCRPASTPTRFVPLTEAERLARASTTSTSPTTPNWSSASAGWCRARGSTPPSAPLALLRTSRPNLVLAIAGGGRDEDRLRRLAEQREGAGAVPRPGQQRRSAAALRLRRRVRDAVSQSVGGTRAGGLRHRVPRGRGVRRAAGGRRLGWCGGSGRRRRHRRGGAHAPTTRVRWPTAFEHLLDDPTLRARMGLAGRDRAVREFSYDVLAHRLGVSLGALAE